MLTLGERPRQLHWYHAGPILFGDWGTSRLYVLGLAFFHTGRASFWFLLAMSFLLVAVGWAYEVICRHYPEGGGVYSAARHRSQLLGVIGALLLCADYVVTAALSALDAFHYLHVPYPEFWAAGAICAIGVVNYFGPTKSGLLALVVAMSTVVLSLVIAGFSVPSLGHVQITGATGNVGNWWSQFTALVLAISGVEAIANMTGIMVRPVRTTTRWSIYPVLAEIVILNLLLTLAMSALPDSVLGVGDPARSEVVRDTMLRVLADYYVGPTFAAIASIAFAALLLSAVNTAVTGLVSVQFMMAHDKELPNQFGGLNRWGMPVMALGLGTVVPVIIVLLVPDVGHLADLYAIGVVGAVTINLGSCTTNFKLALKPWERWPIMCLAGLMAVIWITIAWEKPHALLFACIVLGLGLIGRYVARNSKQVGGWIRGPLEAVWGRSFRPETTPALEAVGPLTPAVSARKPALPDGEKHHGLPSRVLVCTPGNLKLVKFALEQAKYQDAELLALFVRHIAVVPMGPLGTSSGKDDPQAISLFNEVRRMAAEEGVAVHCLYAMSRDIADAILETAVTHGVSQVILGATRRGGLWRAMKGDVIQEVAQYLPEPIRLLITA